MTRPDYANAAAAVIGLVLRHPSLIRQDNVCAIPPEAFGRDQVIWQMMVALDQAGQAPTPNATSAAFRQSGWPVEVSEKRGGNATSGSIRINALAQMVADDDIDYLVSAAIQDYRREEISRRLSDISAAAATDDPTTIQQRIQDEIVEFRIGSTLRGTTPVMVEEVIDARQRPRRGITHNVPGLRQVLPFFEYGWLVGLAASTKGMKSTLARQYIIETAIKQKIPTLVVPLENYNLPTINMLASSLAGIRADLNGPDLPSHQLARLREAGEMIRASPDLHFCEDSNIYTITAMVRELEIKNVVFDQLSHFTGIKASKRDIQRTQEYGLYCKHISEVICKKLGAVALLVHQLKEYGDRRPTIRRDYADSAEIARYVDAEILLHAPDPKTLEREIILDLARHVMVSEHSVAKVALHPQSRLFQEVLA